MNLLEREVLSGHAFPRYLRDLRRPDHPGGLRPEPDARVFARTAPVVFTHYVGATSCDCPGYQSCAETRHPHAVPSSGPGVTAKSRHPARHPLVVPERGEPVLRADVPERQPLKPQAPRL